MINEAWSRRAPDAYCNADRIIQSAARSEFKIIAADFGRRVSGERCERRATPIAAVALWALSDIVGLWGAVSVVWLVSRIPRKQDNRRPVRSKARENGAQRRTIRRLTKNPGLRAWRFSCPRDRICQRASAPWPGGFSCASVGVFSRFGIPPPPTGRSVSLRFCRADIRRAMKRLSPC